MRIVNWSLLGFCILGAAPRLMAQVTFTAEAALGPVSHLPDGTENPIFTQWEANVQQSLTLGGGAVGDFSTDPSAFQPVDTVGQRDLFGSIYYPNAVFPSWRGVADPAPQFDHVYGTGLALPLRVVSTTAKIRLGNLDNIAASNDPADTLGGLSHGVAGAKYSPRFLGIDYGPDGAKGTADDIVYDNGESGDQPVNEILILQAGFSLPVHDYGVSDQDDIDQSVATFFHNIPLTRISNEYLLYDDDGNVLADVTKTVEVTPEPASLGLALPALAWTLRRRRRM